LIIIIQKRYKRRFGQYADDNFWEFYFKDWSFFHFRLKAVLLVSAFAFIILALVRPQWDNETQDIKRSGLDIAICIDASKSMDATDIVPTRLQRARDQITAFIDEQKGDRIALIPFAGIAFIQCPLTDDYDAAKMLLNSVNTNSVPVWGTDIGKALNVAGSVFDKKTKTKVVVLISDGEDLNDSAVKEAKELAQQGIIIYTMGVGTPEGATIRLTSEDGFDVYDNKEITTKLDNKTLEKIASVAGGEFFMITPAQDEIQTILKHISTQESSKLSSLRISLYKEQYHLFAIVALLLLIIETLMSTRTNKSNGRKPAGKASATGLLLLFLLLPMLHLKAINLPWSKALTNSKGGSAYKKQDYQKAEQMFGKNSTRYSRDAVLLYNHGNSLYKLTKEKEAAEAWQKALNSNDKKLQSQAWHNLGNLQYQSKQYQEALESYRKAVLADEQNMPAKANYDLAKRMLIKQQQPQQQTQNQQQQDKQNNKQNQPPQTRDQQQKIDKKEDAERILKALEQKEVNDRQNRQASPQKSNNNKWW